ncbi:MAG: superoxide dismutase, Ni [Candidatus Marinimicrobia bacterium]|nr:superoxide dismutase, Ni [Candidatus Neomarinimicrobiota bacterium]MCF7828029.1 superoxide dismutase, Ni [Candidatus Neomarinimicrobiota bacterium]MCF7879216.1 superoxide dismutase, Ni [Candidatus Neomarinimicrobiota bacterium]
MGKKVVTVAIMAMLSLFLSKEVMAHCQLPCGIYGDNMRIMSIDEHITTIEKSMRLIKELQKNPSENMNQIVRWVNNKENHADELTDILTYYFMAQRVKIPEEKSGEAYKKYSTQLELLHGMMISAMKAKQTTDHKHVEKLRSQLDKFVNAYFSEEDRMHLQKEHGLGGE